MHLFPLVTETNTNLSVNSLDIVSDLHIDQWDSSLNIKNPCGEVSDSVYKFNKTNNRILVIAGDISDEIDLSVNYLNEVSEYYERVLFVDGNHEHVSVFPNLLSTEEIKNKIEKLNNDKIVYLSDKHYKLGKTVFIGYSGWWDYDNNKDESINNSLNYFDGWIKELSESQENSRMFIKNVTEKSREQHNLFLEHLNFYESCDDVDNVIIITHTVPLEQFALSSKGNIDTACQLQSFSKNLVDGRYKKLSKWIFGHTHNQFDKVINGVNFIAHPRGRPEDFNRRDYELKMIN